MAKQRKRLTAAQLARLAPYEKNMYTAVYSDWTRGIGQNGITVLSQVREEVTGEKQFVNRSCPFCLLDLVRTVGRWYFEDKAALAANDTVENPEPLDVNGAAFRERKARKTKKNA